MSDKDILVVGKVIRMPCMRKGLVQYPNEIVYVSQESLYNMAQSAKGIPVVMDHPGELLNEENILKIEVAGRVVDFEYSPGDDLWYANFVVDHAMAVDYLKNGYGISTAWFGDKYAEGGTLNNVSYDKELVEGRYEHLAIVKNPRYEMAKDPIFLNSKPLQSDNNMTTINNDCINKPKRGNSMIGKFFKQLVTREELKTNEGEEIIVNIDGIDTSLVSIISELKELRLNKKNEEEKEEKEEKEDEKKMNESDEIDVDGEKVTIGELKKAWKRNKKANEGSEEKGEEKDEKKENSSEDMHKNSIDPQTIENFEMIKSLHENGITYNLETEFLSTAERVELGRKRYGKK